MKKTSFFCWMIILLCLLTQMTVFAMAEETAFSPEELAGKTVSILGDSISTYAGVSNNSAYNHTLSSNVGFYDAGSYGIAQQSDTWWQRVIDALGMELCVNNSSGGGRILSDETFFGGRSYIRNVAAYKNRCVNLHNNDGDAPDVILVSLGTNDFSYHLDTENCAACKAFAAVCTDPDVCKGTNICSGCRAKSGQGASYCPQDLGTAQIDYAALIQEQDGAFAYAEPATTCEAYAVMLHKMQQAYPDAKIFCMGLLARRDPDLTGGYHDHEQPTAYNGEIKQIAEQFGATYIDLENCGIDEEHTVFDQYIYDKAVHPNASGMELISRAVIDALVGQEATPCRVIWNAENVTAENQSTVVFAGGSYQTALSTAENYEIASLDVTMNGVDITADCYRNGTIWIPKVTGDIVISAEAKKTPRDYRWELRSGSLCSVGNTNALSKSAVGAGVQYKMAEPVVLRHDLPWTMEWRGSGNGGFMLAKAGKSNDGNKYFFHRKENSLDAFGCWSGNQSRNYGHSFSEVDTTTHTYRLKNAITADGNMVWMQVDDGEWVQMNDCYIGPDSLNKTDNWIDGKDFLFNYIGTDYHLFTDYHMEYLQIVECAHSGSGGACIHCGWQMGESGLTHAVPASQGVANAIERAYALTDIEWTPLKDMPGVQKIDGEYTVVPFKAGVTYKGIPYSGVTANDCYVGLNVSPESFLTALKNENSILYTENLFSTNPKSATYFGTVCSKFAQHVLDIPGSYNTNNVANIPGMDTIALPGEYTVDEIRLGDVVLDTAVHTTVCTDILYDADGNVAYIEISEAVMPLVRRVLWTPEAFYEHFASYRLCRYQGIDDVPAADAVNADGDYALMPRFGDRYNYKVSSAKGVVDVLESGYSKAAILRDGVLIDEILLNGASAFNFDRSIPGDLELYLEREDGSRSDSVYVCVVKSSVSVTDSSGFAAGKLAVTFNGSSGTPLYVQVGSAHAIFCSVKGAQGTAELTFSPAKISNRQVRVAYQNENGIYLSSWVPFTADENPSDDPLLSQGQYWNGYNITPGGPTPVVQENKVGYWSYTMVPVEENTLYYSEGATRLWFLDENGDGISTINAYKDGDIPFRFTTPAGTAYVSIAYAPGLVEQGTETLTCLQMSGATVRGTVKGSRGAKVTLQGETTYESETVGSYEFTGVAQGVYDLIIEEGGCLMYTVKNIAVETDDILLPDIELVRGDVNGDEMINARDIGVFRRDFGKAVENCSNPYTDINGDGNVNARDINLLRKSFGKSAAKDCTVEYTP